MTFTAHSINDESFVPQESVWPLPRVQGRYLFGYDLSSITWFKVGGEAEVLFKPKDREDLAQFLMQRNLSMPITLLGAGSNVLVRDGGIKGCVIKLGRGFSDICFEETKDKIYVTVGAACLDRTLVLECAARGFTGLEFLVGIPGSIGGAVAMNAGAYGHEVKDFLVWVEVLYPDGSLRCIKAADLNMTYRDGNLPEGTIVVQSCFTLQKGSLEEIQAEINEYLQQREETQPIHGRTGGSTFKNPDVATSLLTQEGVVTKKAWQLIDEAGCRGLRINDAQVSEKHCNFLLNTNHATAMDLETLGETVRESVYRQSGVMLEWEIIRLGTA